MSFDARKIGRPIDVRGGGPGAKVPHLERNAGIGRKCGIDTEVRGVQYFRYWPTSTGCAPNIHRLGVEGTETPMMTTHGRNGMGGQTTRAILWRRERRNVTSDASDGAGHVASRIRWHFEECGYGCGDW